MAKEKRKLSEWQLKIFAELEEEKNIDKVIFNLPAAKWMIAALCKYKRAYKIINLGAGIKRITTQVDICPKCNGTGKC